MTSFSAQVRSRAEQIKKRMPQIRDTAIMAVVDDMQAVQGVGGRMRVDTGFLRASLVATTSLSLPLKRHNPDGRKFNYDPNTVLLVLLSATMDDVITLSYTANYARFREYGTRFQGPDRFVGLAVQKWQQFVDRAVAEAGALPNG